MREKTMLHKTIKLTTSNVKKIEEFKRFGLSFDIAEGLDLKEVDSSIDDVILYKAIDAGDNLLVEDTVLVVNGEEVVDIRWKIDELKTQDNPDIKWITSLAIKDNGFIYIYRGEIKCALVNNASDVVVPEDAFGFDPYLRPILNNVVVDKTFYELNKEGLKDNYSPRKMAVNQLNNGLFLAKIKSDSVQKWTGNYQHD
jgi:inosine/xanthosine triphosphate pyrophosphatase family protein